MNSIHLAAAITSYLLGSIPFGYLIARAHGIDIRTVGSKNIGATNVFRCVGKGAGTLCFALDMFKGFAATLLVPMAASRLAGNDHVSTSLQIGCAVIAVAGHNWTIFLKFKGGKGVATTAGVLLGLAPAEMGMGFAIWLAMFLTTRYVSLASIIASLSLPAISWIRNGTEAPAIPSTLTALGVMAVLRHRANIRRLLAGTENRFSFTKKADGGRQPSTEGTPR